MKVILVRPNFNSHIITPPLGLGYLSSYLKSKNINVKIIDALREKISNKNLVKKILKESPDLIGITCLTAYYHCVISISLMLKKAGLKVVIGGVHTTFLPYQTLIDSNCDYVILGEGEIALYKLVQNNCINNNIQGVYSQKDFNSREFIPQRAEIMQDLDKYPFPDWESIDPNKYPRAPHGAIIKKFPAGILMTSRGCSFKCTFCATPKFYNKRIRFRSPENVIEEIKYLINDFHVKEIHFEDSNLTMRRSHIDKICNILISKKIDINWACPNGIRADKIDEALIKLMKNSGCYYFAYGIESANQNILENIKKKENIEVIKNAINIAYKEGISCQGFFIFGLPGETKETIEESIQFAKKSKLSRAQFSILDVLPGSELWDVLKGEFNPNWEKRSYVEPEWLPSGITAKQLIKAQSRAFREFYINSPIRSFKLIKQIKIGQLKYLIQRILYYHILITIRNHILNISIFQKRKNRLE